MAQGRVVGVRAWPLTALVLILLTAPAAAQDASPQPGIEVTVGGPTVLYAHLAGADRDFYVNTQPPTEAPDVDLHVDGPASTLACLPDGATSQTEEAFHSWHGVIAAGDIVYEDGLPRPTIHHYELYGDALLNAGADATLYWYLSAAMPGGEAPAGPTPIPNVQVVATWRAGAVINASTVAWESGDVVMQGSTAPVTLVGEQVVGGDGQVQSVGQVGGRQVYEFAVPLAFEGNVMPRYGGASLRVDVRLDGPACNEADDGSLMPDLVALHSSAGFRPRTILEVTNPLRLEYLHPQFVGDDLVLHTSASSPWGCSDIDLNSVQASVKGPSAVDVLYRAPVAQPRPGSPEACDFTYVWSGAASATAGNYSVTFTAATLGGSNVVASSYFVIGEGSKDSPLGPSPPLLAALLGLAVLRRRA